MASMQQAAFFCIPEQTLSPHNKSIYCGLCLASAALGIAGTTWQAYQWKPLLSGYKYRRKPSPNPMIVLSLALADFLACLGVIMRSVAMILTEPPKAQNTTSGWECDITTGSHCEFVPLNDNEPLLALGALIEALNQYFYGVTFMWTVIYAVDIYLQLSNKRTPDTLYHVICWVVPALTAMGSLLTIFLGTNNIFSICPHGAQLVMRYFFYYVLIYFAMLGDPICYIFCNRLINKRMRESGLLNSHNRAIMTALSRKFLAVIIIFSVCWLPNVIDSVIQICVTIAEVDATTLAPLFPLWAIEAILNPLQGLLNCFVYGRHMLFRRIAEGEGRITGPSSLSESTPILYTDRAHSPHQHTV